YITVSVHTAPAEAPRAFGVGAPPPASPRTDRSRRAPAGALASARNGLWPITLLIAAIFCFITFHAKGGLNLESMTSTELALTLGSGVVAAASVILAPARSRRVYGIWPMGLLLLFTAVTAVSIAWSVQPDHSWQDSGRMLAYSAVFGAGFALVRALPERWPAILGGLTLAAVIVCGYALLTKVFPASLDPSNTFARLNEPYGYWNAVGSSAAIGAICCLWLGARRTGHALLRALSYPAMSVVLLTLMLAYSRGAMVALAVGLVMWFLVVPLRLRSAMLLIVAAAGAGVVGAWDFSKHALSAEGVALSERTAAGHQLGAFTLAMLLVLTVVGIAIGFCTGRRAPSLLTRRRAGAVLLAAVVLALVAFAGALAVSQRGFTGSISHAFDALTNPNAIPPGNTPGRLTAVASERARYWKEALKVFDAHPVFGAGAEGYATAHLRYEAQTLEVRHAHSFILQTLADLGLVGLLVALALLFTWMAAAGRATHPFNRRWTSTREGTGWQTWLDIRTGVRRPGWRRIRERKLRRYTPERIGLLSMLCVVVVFGAHSLIDWTWYVPGNACVALLCAGWLAGRGPLHTSSSTAGSQRAAGAIAGRSRASSTAVRVSSTARGRAVQPSAVRVLLATAVIVAVLLAAWSEWQPQRSEDARQEAETQLEAHDQPAALAAANSAVSRDPLSTEALFTLASVQQVSGQPALARATLAHAVRLQPSNPQTWLVLGRYDLTNGGRPQTAVKELEGAIYLNPASISAEAIDNGEREAIEIHNDYLQALQAVATQQQARARAAVALAAARRARIKSAHASRGRAAAAGRAGARHSSALGSPGSRTPQAAG
ncbi:MAG TPA: O-antigen ligase family protein, partial [Solirubrobacteraceae bacterium]